MDRVDETTALTRLGTGIPALDAVLGGGIPQQSLTVLTGAPGTGKTVLAMQMVFEQARLGRRCLYVTTASEPALKVIRYMRLFSFFDEDLIDDRVWFADLGTALLRDGAIGITAVLQAKLEALEPDFVVIDSFKAIYDFTDADPSAQRRVAFDLAVLLGSWGITALLLGEYGEGEDTRLPEFAVADGIIHLSNLSSALTRVRGLEAQKLRGTYVVPGRHFFEITPAGIVFFPRLRGVESATEGVWVPTKVKTGVPGLDQLLNDGLPSGSTTLIEGGTGTGKSLLALQFLIEGVRHGERGVHFGLEERPSQLRGIARSLGWDLPALEKAGLLQLHYTSPVEINADQFANEAIALIRKFGASRVVLDSATALALGLEGSGRFRELVYALATHLREEGVASILTAEGSELLGVSQRSGPVVSAIADNVIRLRYREASSQFERTVEVVKVRGSGHSLEVRKLHIGEEGLTVGDAVADTAGLRASPGKGGLARI